MNRRHASTHSRRTDWCRENESSASVKTFLQDEYGINTDAYTDWDDGYSYSYQALFRYVPREIVVQLIPSRVTGNIGDSALDRREPLRGKHASFRRRRLTFRNRWSVRRRAVIDEHA